MFLGYQEDQWEQAALVPGGHQQEDPELTGAAEESGWRCSPSLSFAAPSSWNDWEGVSTNIITRRHGHLWTEIFNSISCFMLWKQNSVLGMFFRWLLLGLWMTHFFFSSMKKYETAASAFEEAPRPTWSHLLHLTIRAGSHRQLGKDSWWETGVYLNIPRHLSFECTVSNEIDSCLNVFWCRQMWTTKNTEKICWSSRMKWRSTIFSTVKLRHWLRTSLQIGYFLTAYFKCSSE